MRCPNCGNEVPARPICLRCGATLFGEAALPPSALGPVQVPLTFGQRARLLAECWPVVTVVLVTGGYLYLVSREIVPGPPLLLSLVLLAAFLFTGHQAVQSLRDLASGSALAQEDLLNESRRSGSGQGRGTCWGVFERLGRMRMVPKVYFQNSPGRRYRVVYSPVSKIVWALEPPDLRIR